MEEVEETGAEEQISPEMKQAAMLRAKEKARVARWDLNIAIFLFAVLIIVIILLFQGIRIEVVATVALFGLVMVWLCGWRRGQQLYNDFYNQEIDKLGREMKEKERVDGAVEETIEEKVQKALRERWR